jgi:hypothetical protein
MEFGVYVIEYVVWLEVDTNSVTLLVLAFRVIVDTVVAAGDDDIFYTPLGNLYSDSLIGLIPRLNSATLSEVKISSDTQAVIT